jgi:hypothetical protein
MSDEDWADSAFYGSDDIGINDDENANSAAARIQADSDGESEVVRDKSVAKENDGIGSDQDEQNENMTDEEHDVVCVNDNTGAGAGAGAVKTAIPFNDSAGAEAGQTTHRPERSSATFLASHLGLAGFGDTDSPLVQAVRELTENALDSHATRVRVQVTLGKPLCSRGGCTNYLIEVEDNGCGLPSDTLETLLGSVFSSTKAGGAAGGAANGGGRGGGRGFGRYGIGVKAALLYASSSLELLGIPNATPLFIATATAEATSLTSAYLGIGGLPLSVKVIDRRELSKEGGDDDNIKDLHGTFIRLSLSADAYTARARIAGDELQAYFARFALLPRAGGADIEFSLDTAASLALCCNDGNSALIVPTPARSFSHIANEALVNGREAIAVANQSLGTGGGAAAGPNLEDISSGISINAPGIEHVPGWQIKGREQLARALRVPLACVAVAAARAATTGPMVEVRVWIVMTPDGSGGDGGGGGDGNAPPASRESALIHILRFSCGVPLIRGASACALSRGAIDNQSIWSGIGLTLERAARGAPSRRTVAALSAAPAAPLARRSVMVDAPGAWIATSSVGGFPLVPFSEARVFIDARGTPGAPPLAFTDLSKTSLRLGRGGARCPAALTRVALKSALATLRTQLPANLLEPASARHVRLLRDVYLPDIAAQLVAALSDAGEGSNTWQQARQNVESVAGTLPLGSFQVQLEAVRRFLATRLDAQADLVLSVADEVGGGSVRDNKNTAAPSMVDDVEGLGTDNSEWVEVAAASVEHLDQPIDDVNESSGSDDFSAALSSGREFARTMRQAEAKRLRRRLREE